MPTGLPPDLELLVSSESYGIIESGLNHGLCNVLQGFPGLLFSCTVEDVARSQCDGLDHESPITAQRRERALMHVVRRSIQIEFAFSADILAAFDYEGSRKRRWQVAANLYQQGIDHDNGRIDSQPSGPHWRQTRHQLAIRRGGRRLFFVITEGLPDDESSSSTNETA